jgi:hypothetical protein
MPRSKPDDPPTRKRPPFFWWFLANTLAIAFAITSWIVCLNLFRDPTNPTSYDWMMKVGRVSPLASFAASETPEPATVSGPRDLEARFANFGKSELATVNQEFLREYLTNFEKAPLLTVLTGEFRVTESRELSSEDFLSPGIVVKAQALVRPDAVADPLPYPVFIECVFPTTEASPEAFPPGQSFVLKKEPHCAALLNVATTNYNDREVILATVVPLAAIEFTPPQGPSFKITPPERANPAASLPALP